MIVLHRNVVAVAAATVCVFGAISWRGDYDAAHREALKEHKRLVVLLVRADDAARRALRRLARVNLTDAVGVLINVKQARYPIEMYYTTRLPALFVVDSREVFVCEPLYEEAIVPEALQRCLTRR